MTPGRDASGAPGCLPRANALARPAEQPAEKWKPPLFAADATGTALSARVRRFFDLQAGSIWDDLARILPAARGTVVDVGCGAQPYRCLLPQDARYVGVDRADALAHFGYGTAPDVRTFSGDRWPVADGEADVVLCSETLEHVRDPRGFLAEARRSLAPRGRLVLTVPFAARWHFIPHDYYRYTPSGLELLLREAGFTAIAVYPRGNAVTVACYKAMAVLLPFLFPQGAGAVAAVARRVVGLLTLPLFVALAVAGNLSRAGDGGDDCLGHTVLAESGGAGTGR